MQVHCVTIHRGALVKNSTMCSLPVTLNTWVDETNVVFIIEIGSDLLGNLDELLQVLAIGEVGVKVILVVLKLVHLLDGIVVVSDLWEREGLVVELFGGDGEFWVNSSLLEFLLDFHGVFPVLHVEVSGELTELIVELILGVLEWLWAVLSFRLELHETEKSLLVVGDIDNSIRSSGEEKGSDCKFHVLTEKYIIYL